MFHKLDNLGKLKYHILCQDIFLPFGNKPMDKIRKKTEGTLVWG